MLAAAGSGQPPLVSMFIFVLVVVAYFAPSIIASGRHVRGVGQVVVVNLFLGWTVIGWIVALVMAFRERQPAPEREPLKWRWSK